MTGRAARPPAAWPAVVVYCQHVLGVGHLCRSLEIAKALAVNGSTVTRDLDNLRTAGWAELTPKGDRWRLTPHVIQISLRYATALNAGAQQWRDVQQRYGRAVGELSAIN